MVEGNKNKKVGRRSVLTDRQKKEIEEAYASGFGTRAIANAMLLNQKTVYNYLKKQGLIRKEDKKVLDPSSVNGENQKMKKRIEELEERVEMQTSVIQKAEKDNEALKQENQRLKSEYAEMATNYELLKQENQQLREENEKLKKENAELLARYNALKAMVQGVKENKEEKKEEKEIIIKSPFNTRFVEEMKKIKKKRWDPENKTWAVILSEGKIKKVLRDCYCYDKEYDEIVMKYGKCCQNFGGTSGGGRYYCRGVCMTRKQSNDCYNLRCKDFRLRDKFRELNEDEISKMISSHSYSFLEVGYENHNEIPGMGSRGIEK